MTTNITNNSKVNTAIKLSPLSQRYLGELGKPKKMIFDLIERREINHRRLGKYGVYATRDLCINTTIGIWTGMYWTESEYQKLNEEDQAVDYAISFEFERKIFYITPSTDNPVMWVNDGRITKNINRHNSYFIQRQYGDFPLVCLVTSENIIKGEQIYCDYGEDYWSSRNLY